MEVHVLLLTDMLLICKPTTKKMFKIIRQPYVVDRIRIHEVKEPSSLGLVYLNEYGTVSAALILSAGDPKLAKVTRQTTIMNYDQVRGMLIHCPVRFKFRVRSLPSLTTVFSNVA